MSDVARLAGVPNDVVTRADQVSAEFFKAFKEKLEGRRQSALPLVAHADFAWLLRLAQGEGGPEGAHITPLDETMEDGGEGGASWKTCAQASLASQLDVVRRAIGRYEAS